MSDKHDILIVDDEQVILAAARRILEREGLSVRTADSAETAIEIMNESPADLVVIDLKLPGMSGLEFLELARDKFPDTLVILMTGYATATYAVSSLAGGAFDYLPKPFAFQELLSPVRRAIRYLALDESRRAAVSQSERSSHRCLGKISWARKEADGHFLLGPTLVFMETVGPVVEIAVPSGNEIVHQGGPLAKITGTDGLVHHLWVPLSGRMIDVNTKLVSSPELFATGDPDLQWIARVAALDPVAEFQSLLAG